MVEANPMYDPGCNHDLPIPGPGCNRGMWTCRYPECTYPEAAPRRVRTQAERDAEAADKGHAFHPGGAVSGEPVRIHLHPDECFVRPSGGGFVCVRVTHRPPPMTADCCGNPPRRRWWHRLTRRNP